MHSALMAGVLMTVMSTSGPWRADSTRVWQRVWATRCTRLAYGSSAAINAHCGWWPGSAAGHVLQELTCSQLRRRYRNIIGGGEPLRRRLFLGDCAVAGTLAAMANPTTEAMIQRRIPLPPIRSASSRDGGAVAAAAMTFSLCRQRLSGQTKPTEARQQTSALCRGYCLGSATSRPPRGMRAPTPTRPFSIPFLAHGSSQALEDAGAVGGRSGWTPRPPRAQGRQQAIVACAPCLPEVAQPGRVRVRSLLGRMPTSQAGGRYYPKLQIAVPFTPVPGPPHCWCGRVPRGRASEAARWPTRGPRVVERNGPVRAATSRLPAKANGSGSGPAASSSAPTSSSTGAMPATRSFDDFLASLASRKRKGSAQGARRGAWQPVSPSNGSPAARSPRRTGTRSSPSTWTPAHASGDGPISTARSFSLIGAAMPAKAACWSWPCAAGGHRRRAAHDRRRLPLRPLLGRRRAPSLPAFRACCYYQAIEFAIAARDRARRGRRQGEHKLARGYLPTKTYSAHYIADPACAGRSPTISSASALTWTRPARSSPNTRRSAGWRRIRPDARLRAR